MGLSQKRKDVRERERKALEMYRSEQYTLEDIAEELGYADPSGVSKLIDRTLDRYVSLEVEKFRAQRLDKLSALAETFYPKGRMGNIAASAEYRKIDERMAKYIPNLEAPQKVQMDVSADEQTAAALAILNELKSRTTDRSEDED